MPQSETTQLKDEVLSVWVDRIIIPVLKRACPTDVLHHLPRSYLHVDRKANVKYEAFITSTGIAMDVRYTIPEKYLDKL